MDFGGVSAIAMVIGNTPIRCIVSALFAHCLPSSVSGSVLAVDYIHYKAALQED